MIITDVLDKTIKIHEIYKSFQNKGLNYGKPTVFIYIHSKGKEIALREIIEHVKDFDCCNICITGDEPLLQENLSFLIYKLICYFKVYNMAEHSITIETHGAVAIEDLTAKIETLLYQDYNPTRISDSLNFIIEYKLPSSNAYGSFNLKNFDIAEDYTETVIMFKFVISTLEDYRIAKKICSENDEIFCNYRALFSPVSDGEISKEKLAEKIIEDNLQVRFFMEIKDA